MARLIRTLAATVIAILFGALAMPACVSQIDQGRAGGGADTNKRISGGRGVTGDDPDSVVDTDAFAKADQKKLALHVMAAAYAANATEGLVAAHLADPENPDPATVEKLIDEYTPAGWDAALKWLSSVDPSTLSIDKGVIMKEECILEPTLCRTPVWCPFGEGNVGCTVSQCGTGKCPWCPFGGNLVFKAWCAYGCIRKSDGEVVGGAFELRTIFNNYNGPFCIKF